VPEPDLDHPLDFAAVTGAFSDPASWPAPFTIAPGNFHPEMVEVAPGHWVRIGALHATELAS
jgi:peptide/nickel transport system ATP-binding protein